MDSIVYIAYVQYPPSSTMYIAALCALLTLSHCPSISQYTWNGLPQPGSMVYTPEVVQPPAYTSLQLRGRRLGHCSPVKWRTVHGSSYLPLLKMSTCALTGLPMAVCHCCKCYHQKKRIWEEHDDSTVHSVSQSDHELGTAQCPAVAWADFYSRPWVENGRIFAFPACGWSLIMWPPYELSHHIIIAEIITEVHLLVALYVYAACRMHRYIIITVLTGSVSHTTWWFDNLLFH